jgi:nucleotide-binding universal stress UspA family protein
VSDQSARHLQLVVVGSDDLGGSAGLLLGSASTDVIPTACIPVIVAGQH